MSLATCKVESTSQLEVDPMALEKMNANLGCRRANVFNRFLMSHTECSKLRIRFIVPIARGGANWWNTELVK